MSQLERILHYFPETELPVIVSDEHLSSFEASASPFPQAFVDEIVSVWEGEADDFTEFIPCFRLPGQEKFDAIVFWKGSLLRYDFVLATLDKNGNIIGKKAIASTIVQDALIRKSIASIEPDLTIHIIAGQTVDGTEYEASLSKAFSMEILPDGQIIFHLEGEDVFR
jgi:hypothetical protein